MERDDVMAWVEAYESAWRDDEVDAVDELFADDAVYRPSPYEDPIVGLAAIKEFWPEADGTTFTMAAAPVAVDGSTAVVRVLVRYERPRRQEYTDLWLLHFDDDGRVDSFEEWAYWPGRPYSAED